MAPIRRYLRITRHSVLEVRIYPDPPSLTGWLLATRSPALPRILAAARPLVLPKLREEHESARRKGGAKKRRATKDMVGGEDFEAAVFLTESGGRHALMTKRKMFAPGRGRLRGGRKLGVGGGGEGDPIVVRLEDEGEEAVRLEDIPLAGEGGGGRGTAAGEAIEVRSDDEEDVRAVSAEKAEQETGGEDDKKKLGLRTEYEGFSIYGKILCLVVKRKGTKARAGAANGSSQMLENWVSTQMEAEGVSIDD